MRAVWQFVVITTGAVELLGLAVRQEADLINGWHQSCRSFGVKLDVSQIISRVVPDAVWITVVDYNVGSAPLSISAIDAKGEEVEDHPCDITSGNRCDHLKACIDTFCCGGGWLTALDVRTEEV
jgi:hypothetical protein